MQDMPQMPSHRHFLRGLRQSSSARHFRKHTRPYEKKETKLACDEITTRMNSEEDLETKTCKIEPETGRGLHHEDKNPTGRCVDSYRISSRRCRAELVAGCRRYPTGGNRRLLLGSPRRRHTGCPPTSQIMSSTISLELVSVPLP